MIKTERATKSQGEIALSSAVDTVKEGIKSFNEHRNLLRKGSFKIPAERLVLKIIVVIKLKVIIQFAPFNKFRR